MKLPVVGETAPLQKGGGKVSERQESTGGFDTAMAAVMALLRPISNEPTPPQCQKDGNPVFPEEIIQPSGDNKGPQKAEVHLPQQGLLPGGLVYNALDGAGSQEQPVSAEDVLLTPRQMAWADKNESLLFPDNFTDKQVKAEAFSPEEVTLQVPEKAEKRQEAAKPDSMTKGAEMAEAEKRPSSISAGGIRENNISPKNQEVFIKGVPPPEDQEVFTKGVSSAEKQETVAKGPSPQNPVISEKNAVRAALAALGSNEGKLHPDVTLMPEASVRAAAQKGIIETGRAKLDGMEKIERAEEKGTVMLSAKIEAAGTSHAGEAKNESGSFNSFSGGTTQQNPGLSSSASAPSGPVRIFEGVSLPDLKGVLVQEIKNIYNARKGEPAQVQIKLEPENLGKLTIKLFYKNGELNAHFYAGSDHVKGILEGSMQQLRESLSQQELVLNQAFVFVGNEESGGFGSRMEYENRQAELFNDRYYEQTDSESQMEPDDYFHPGTGSAHVNYLI